jgi:hypothetical protein
LLAGFSDLRLSVIGIAAHLTPLNTAELGSAPACVESPLRSSNDRNDPTQGDFR